MISTIHLAGLFSLCLALAPAVTHGAGAEAPGVELTAEPAHHLALENEFVRVFQVNVAPHASTLLHRHGHDYLFVSLGDAHFMNEVQGKAAVEVKLADGEARFTPGDFAHVAKNLADRHLVHEVGVPQTNEQRSEEHTSELQSPDH